ncbi:MAG: SRPBCC family protein [Myxococcaceae bacterium]|nr:SRPBCC family protein [Myxococcaceae bacterium]MCA3015722.1 SRPBCC family protein [Myxococcaceae bacterium]
MTSLALVPLLLLAADEPAWEQAANTDGVRVFARKRGDGDVREMKAQGLIDAPPVEVWKAVRDYDNYPKTMPYVEGGKVLSREGGDKGDKVTLLYSLINTPLVDRRDYIIRLVDETDWKNPATLKVTWTVVNDMDEKVPVPKDVVRVRVNEGYWLLEPREDGKKTFATYYVYTSPGGAIPNFIINKANSMAVPAVFNAIKKTCGKK